MRVGVLMFGLSLGVTFPGSYSELVSCVDEENNSVDWYVIYKLPKVKSADNLLIKNGLAYLYMTSNSVKEWVLSSKPVNSTGSLPGRTMSQLYESCSDKNSNLLWLIYNDEPVNGTPSLDLGHTKGVVVANADGGFWLIHSVPKFPPVPCTSQMYGYPTTGLHYGQSFLCISMAAKSLDTVGAQLLYNEPELYSSQIPFNLKSVYPNLSLASHKKWIETAPWFHEAALTTRKGDSFRSFAKSRHFGKDLYADLVAPHLKSDLFVESWQNGEGKLPSACQSDFIVENIAAVKFDTGKSQFLEFRSSKDHSKWTVASNSSKPWVCIGDINRMASTVTYSVALTEMSLISSAMFCSFKFNSFMFTQMLQETQRKRGGGTVCTSNQGLWTAYISTVQSVDSCPLVKYLGNKASYTEKQPTAYLLFFVLILNSVIQMK